MSGSYSKRDGSGPAGMNLNGNGARINGQTVRQDRPVERLFPTGTFGKRPIITLPSTGGPRFGL